MSFLAYFLTVGFAKVKRSTAMIKKTTGKLASSVPFPETSLLFVFLTVQETIC